MHSFMPLMAFCPIARQSAEPVPVLFAGHIHLTGAWLSRYHAHSLRIPGDLGQEIWFLPCQAVDVSDSGQMPAAEAGSDGEHQTHSAEQPKRPV
jgi:hypothetical protein